MVQWADKYRYLPRESSSRPGRYRSGFAPYQIEPQESFNDPTVSVTVLMWASQVGKTEILNNAVGYFIHADPSPILVVQPTVEMAESWSKERLSPTIRDTPVLAPLVKDPRSRDSGNTVVMKSFPGGNIAIVGANSPAGLAGRPRRFVAVDEVDRCPASAGTEGDPVALAIRRTESFWNSVIILTSTPTVRGSSRIEKEFDQTDRRLWFCPCPVCGAFQTLKWSQVKWPQGEPEKAVYECEACRGELNDADRVQMVRSGEWRATAPFKGKRGYHLNGIASPFPAKRGFSGRLHQMAAGFLEAKAGGPMMLRAWVNTFLAETWADEGEDVEPHPLMQRREDYGCEVPNGAVLLTAGIDVQSDRVELEIVGWGIGEESWGIFYGRFPGNPEIPGTWIPVEEALGKAYVRKDGVQLRVSCGLVDSGFATKAVYDWAKKMHVRSIYASKGIPGQGKPLAGRFGKPSTARVIMYPIGVDTAKELIYSRLKIQNAGPGFCHFPNHYDEEWFMQLTAERKVKKFHKGFLRVEWEKVRPRNEALDCRVYAQAALACRNFDLKAVASRVAKTASTPLPSDESANKTALEQPRQPIQRSPFRKSGSSWVGRWRL